MFPQCFQNIFKHILHKYKYITYIFYFRFTYVLYGNREAVTYFLSPACLAELNGLLWHYAAPISKYSLFYSLVFTRIYHVSCWSWMVDGAQFPLLDRLWYSPIRLIASNSVDTHWPAEWTVGFSIGWTWALCMASHYILKIKNIIGSLQCLTLMAH